MEAAAMGLILLLVRPYSETIKVVKTISLPMIIGNAAGVTIFIYMMKNLIKEKYL